MVPLQLALTRDNTPSVRRVINPKSFFLAEMGNLRVQNIPHCTCCGVSKGQRESQMMVRGMEQRDANTRTEKQNVTRIAEYLPRVREPIKAHLHDLQSLETARQMRLEVWKYRQHDPSAVSDFMALCLQEHSGVRLKMWVSQKSCDAGTFTHRAATAKGTATPDLTCHGILWPFLAPGKRK